MLPLSPVPVKKPPVMESCADSLGRKEFVRAMPSVKPKRSKKSPPVASCHPPVRSFVCFVRASFLCGSLAFGRLSRGSLSRQKRVELLQNSGGFILDLEFEHGVIRFSQLARLIVEFKFLQLGIEPGTFLAELGVRAGILRVDARDFARCRFAPDAGQEVGVGRTADGLRFLRRPATQEPKGQGDPQNQDDERQDPHQKAETSGRRGEQNPLTVFGDKKIFDLLRSFAGPQLLADDAAHLLGHFRRRIRNREILADDTAQFLRDVPCLLVDIRRARPPVADSPGADEG